MLCFKQKTAYEMRISDCSSDVCSSDLVFSDDPEFQQIALDWAEEEVQHGVALGKWAGLADPTFVYDDALQRFRDGFKIDLNADASVRGSRTGELIARCMVEVGTKIGRAHV